MRNAFELGKEKHRSGVVKKKCTKVLEQPVSKDDFLKCTFPALFLFRKNPVGRPVKATLDPRVPSLTCLWDLLCV